MAGEQFLSRKLLLAVGVMAAIIVASNILVQHPFTPLGLQDYLTWGAFTYPIAFLVTDLTNRWLGAQAARRVVYVGFAIAVVLSIVLATPRIALASGTAFLVAQLIDVSIFDRLRQANWWKAPLVSSIAGSVLDTAIFFTLAFAGTGIDTAIYPIAGGIEAPIWVGWAVVDCLVKFAVALALLLPFRAFMGAPASAQA